MTEYIIKIPNRLDELRNESLLALKGVQIGPLFPGSGEQEKGSRHMESRKTKNADWMACRRARRVRRRIARTSRRRNR